MTVHMAGIQTIELVLGLRQDRQRRDAWLMAKEVSKD